MIRHAARPSHATARTVTCVSLGDLCGEDPTSEHAPIPPRFAARSALQSVYQFAGAARPATTKLRTHGERTTVLVLGPPRALWAVATTAGVGIGGERQGVACEQRDVSWREPGLVGWLSPVALRLQGCRGGCRIRA